MQASKRFLKSAAAASLVTALVAQSAFAAAPDYSTLTADVDWSTVVTGLLAVGALLAAVLAAKKGVRMLLSLIK